MNVLKLPMQLMEERRLKIYGFERMKKWCAEDIENIGIILREQVPTVTELADSLRAEVRAFRSLPGRGSCPTYNRRHDLCFYH